MLQSSGTLRSRDFVSLIGMPPHVEWMDVLCSTRIPVACMGLSTGEQSRLIEKAGRSAIAAYPEPMRELASLVAGRPSDPKSGTLYQAQVSWDESQDLFYVTVRLPISTAGNSKIMAAALKGTLVLIMMIHDNLAEPQPEWMVGLRQMGSNGNPGGTGFSVD